MRRKPWDTRLAAWTPFAPGWVHTVHWTNKLLSKRTRGKEMTGNLKGEKPLQNGKSPPSSFPLHSLSSTIDLFGSLDTGWHLFYFIPLLKYLWCDFMSHPILSRPKNNYDGINQFGSPFALLLVALVFWEDTILAARTKRDWLGTESRDQTWLELKAVMLIYCPTCISSGLLCSCHRCPARCWIF